MFSFHDGEMLTFVPIPTVFNVNLDKYQQVVVASIMQNFKSSFKTASYAPIKTVSSASEPNCKRHNGIWKQEEGKYFLEFRKIQK